MAVHSPTNVLVDVSIRVILDGQAASGAYIASPNFSQYGFAWLRDGSYCALAMDSAGERESAASFHQWVAQVITREEESIKGIVANLTTGVTPSAESMLPTRYTLDGAREPVHDENWPNFQLDGYGTWLFAVGEHLTEAPAEPLARAVGLAADYLAAAWSLPCFDYWEEFGDRVHTSTLAAVAAGLRAAAAMLDREELSETADAVMATIAARCVVEGAFVKGPDDARVDASLISLATPFRLIAPSDPIMMATIARIRAELLSDTGGVRRYVGDTYYGGSPWMLLTAWLGWHLRAAGDEEGYAAARRWVENHADANGQMPEQIVDEPQDASFVEPWVRRWGTVADPLLWSHAKYLLMVNAS